MNILTLEHISKIYGEKKIFDDVSYGIQEGDKIGVIGINGTGKTTLLKILAGLEEPDEGQIVTQKGLRIAYLPQHPHFEKEERVLSYVMGQAREISGQQEQAWSRESEAKTILNHLGIADHEALLAHLSGGQKKRVALARTLLCPFELLILDEPTNHLDAESAIWLEEYLRQLKAAVLMVTHDRYFLDRVTNQILEIDHGKLYSYASNYSGFLEKKAQREEMELSSERKRQSILRMELEWAKRGCRARTTKQRARLERLEALKQGKAPVRDAKVELETLKTRMGRKTVELHGISKSYGEKKLIDDFTYIVLKNQRLGIVGANGCGKSTLLKIIAGLLEPDAGYVEVGETIRMGYFSQEVPDMDTNQRVIDYIRDIAEYVPVKDGRISASSMLERFLFTPDMQYAPIGKLSGGEKKRLYLMSILIAAPNCLVLDEITNDMDIPTLTILEDYLDTFPGIVIAVSHDRYFLDNVVDRIFVFEGNGHLRQYEGGYTDYLDALAFVRQEEGEGTEGQKSGKAKGTEAGKAESREKTSEKEWKKNAPVKLKFSFKEQREFETIDEEIAALEERIQQLEGEMEANASQYTKLTELAKEKEAAEQALDEKMERWVYLNELKEKIEAQNT